MERNESKTLSYPLKERTKNCEFTINTGKTINIREFDMTGRYKMIGWSLPKDIMEELLARKVRIEEGDIKRWLKVCA